MTAKREKIDDLAKQASSMANRLLSAIEDAERFLDHNSSFSVDWGNAQTPPPNLAVDEQGFIVDMDFTPAQVSNAIGVMADLKAWINAEGRRGVLHLVSRQ